MPGKNIAFEKYAQEILEENKTPGGAVIVSRDDRVEYFWTSGCRDNNGKEIDEDTIFGIASLTKSITGVAIIQLKEDGFLSLSDPVTKYLAGFSIPGYDTNKVTIHNLLNHTSGLPPLPCFKYSFWENTSPDIGEEEMNPPYPINNYGDLIDFIAGGEFEMLGHPGEYSSYSNDGYALLGAIIEEVSGLTYSQYVKEKILDPLEMERSTFCLDQVLEDGNRTTLYYKKGEDIFCSPNWQEAPPFYAAGSLKSTPRDMIKYTQMLAQGGEYKGRKLISKEGLAKITYPGAPFSLKSYYGYGFHVQPSYHGVTIVDHGGNLKGASSHAGFIPEKGISAVVLTNLRETPSGKIWMGAINWFLGLKPATPRFEYHEKKWARNRQQRLMGTYHSDEGGTIIIEQKENKLVLKLEGSEVFDKEYPIHPVANDTAICYLGSLELELGFLFDGQDEARAIRFGGRIIKRKK